MVDRRLFNVAIRELGKNRDQVKAVHEQNHCVVLAGPGSGKTKTLTIAMARALIEDIQEPRGIACITYNNECAIELQTRLQALGIEPSKRIFIGTVHSFALTQIIYPYARCLMPEIATGIRVATKSECRSAIELAYQTVINGNENPHERWKFAESKRRRDVDRSLQAWHGNNQILADLIEAYEAELRRNKLIDFDDMPLMAFRMISQHDWVRRSLNAKFPVLFVDEYQDLGHALHELVLLLCFQGGIRLFAVGDPDQSIYAFLGANPQLLESLQTKPGVEPIQLRFNYRCGKNIIQASMAALGEERNYLSPKNAKEGIVNFHAIDGDIVQQADFIFSKLIPSIQKNNIPLEQIAVLYRWASHGEEVANKAKDYDIPIVRADNNALVKRSSRLSRLIEACANWVAGGWKDGNPPFRRLKSDATSIVLGPETSEKEQLEIQAELIRFLTSTINTDIYTHEWLILFHRNVISSWQKRARTITEDWKEIEMMIEKTDPANDINNDLPLSHFGGRIEGSGRLNLSTLHSAKGREFLSTIMFGMNNDIIPNYYERKNKSQFREARRQFYVGVTRARQQLHLVFRKKMHSPFVLELYKRSREKSV